MNSKNLNFSKDSKKNKKNKNDRKIMTFANISSRKEMEKKFPHSNSANSAANFDRRNQLLSKVGTRQSANVISSGRAIRSQHGERMSFQPVKGSPR